MSSKVKKASKGGYSYKKKSSKNKHTYYDYQARTRLFRSPYVRKMTGEREPSTVEEWNATEFGPSYALATDAQKLARVNSGYRGRGSYGWSDFKKDWKSTGLGKSLARSGRRLIGAATDKAIGMLGSGLYGGQGNYAPGMIGGMNTDVNLNQLIEGSNDIGQRIFGHNDETDSITISDTEFVRNIYAPALTGSETFTRFAQETLAVNPGLQYFAPNLSQIAINYGEVEWLQLLFELRPLVEPSLAGNGNVGKAYMVFNYNANDDPFDNSDDIMQAHAAASGKITTTIGCGVECDPSKTNKTSFFVRPGPVPFGKDNDEYDIGVLTIASEGIPSQFANFPIFELHVKYSVTLRKRKAGTIKLANQQMDMFVATGSIASSSLFNGQFISGNGGVLASHYNSIGGKLEGPAVRTLKYTFPANYQGLVRARLWVEGASSAFTGTTLTINPNCSITTVKDMYGPNLAGDVKVPEAFVEMYSTDGCYYEVTLRVRNSIAGIENSFTLLLASSTASTVSSWTFTVYEHTMNHWTSRTNPNGVFVNVSDGIQYAPAS